MHSLRNRILLFFSLFAAVSFAAVFMSYQSTQIVGGAAHNIANEQLPLVHAIGEMETALLKQEDTAHRYVLTGEKYWKDQFEKEKTNYTRWFIEATKISSVEYEQDKLSQLDELYVQYENQIKKILLTPFDKTAEIKKMLAQADEFLNQITALTDQIDELRQGMSLVRQEQIRSTLRRHERFTLYFLVIIIFFFVMLALYLVHYLVKPLSLILDGIHNFTRGRLDIQIPSVGKDELGQLQEAFNEMAREISTERKRLKSESQSDPLTGLFNMRYFRIQLVDEFSRSQRYAHNLSLLMIDVDHFKAYNDRNGHPAGDIVLKELSRILIRNIRGTDIVARYGGEEFVVMLPETAGEAAAKVAEKVRKAVETHIFPFQDQTSTERLSVSVGVAGYPDGQITSDHDLIEASDKALYQAKKNGRNQVCMFSEMDGKTAKPLLKKPKETHH